MIIESFVAGPWQTNCYVVAPSSGSECLILDPGQDALGPIKEKIEKHNLKPIAVLLTHGHLDHMWSVFPVASGYEIPALIHRADRHLLSDPGAGLSDQTKAILPELVGHDYKFVEPDEIIEIQDEIKLNLAGFDIKISSTPGHTQGSVIYSINSNTEIVFSGDTLFAGAIGRVDLPGGSASAMNATLRDIICKLPEETLVYPGHGPMTRMEVELRTNEYLRRVQQGLPAV